MKNLENYLSLPQTDELNNESNISDSQEWIKTHYEDALTDSHTAEELAEEAKDLSIFLQAKSIMKTPRYKAYKDSVKNGSNEPFII
jgi:hypothetical protein